MPDSSSSSSSRLSCPKAPLLDHSEFISKKDGRLSYRLLIPRCAHSLLDDPPMAGTANTAHEHA